MRVLTEKGGYIGGLFVGQAVPDVFDVCDSLALGDPCRFLGAVAGFDAAPSSDVRHGGDLPFQQAPIERVELLGHPFVAEKVGEPTASLRPQLLA